jgi:hypothetical protein
MFTTPLTEFIELNFSLNKFLILASPVVYVLACFAAEFYKLIL